MNQPQCELAKSHVENAVVWYHGEIQQLANLLGSQFPNYEPPSEVRQVQDNVKMLREFASGRSDPIEMVGFVDQLRIDYPPRQRLFKQIILRYRRFRAAWVEGLLAKTFHLELTATLEREINDLNGLIDQDWFASIETMRLPRLKDYLSVEAIEKLTSQTLPERQYDEKFHILQAPTLFLPDLAYFRAKCESRDTPVAIAFLDIDNFKQFNTEHTETKVDRNLLPRLMQTMEGHVFQHGYAYRQGGDEYLILLPSLTKSLAIEFFDDLRVKLASLRYPEIDGSTTVSIGVCIADPDCSLTDRELQDRANKAKKFAKDNGKNRIATYDGPRFILSELRIVRPLKA